MPKISVRDNENNRWKRKKKNLKNEVKKTNNDRKKTKGEKNYSERVRAKWYCCAFKLDFLQLIYVKLP